MNLTPSEPNQRFFANIMHEIRTPIQTIITTTELLKDSNLSSDQKEHLYQIEFSANILLHLSNDMLDLTKIHTNEFKLEYIPYDVLELSEHVIELVSIDAFNKELELITDFDYSMTRMVMGDPIRMQQIILNLVKNAVKFTKKGFVRIRLCQKDNQILCYVDDSGIGIAEEKQKQIFNEYYQAEENIARQYGGAGLGLAIAKKLVEAMGGKIGVKTNSYGGSTFWFSVPLTKAPIKNKTESIVIPSNTKVLIVDCDKMTLECAKKKYIALGIKKIFAESTIKGAYKTLREAAKTKEPFTVVLIRKDMPTVSGTRLASAIRKDPLLKKIKIYLATAEGQTAAESSIALEKIVDGYVHKPIKLKKIASLLAVKKESSENLLTTENIPLTERKIHNRTILLAEDHPVNRKLLSLFLKRCGANVYLAEDGIQAVEQIKLHPNTDIIFMDILMPNKNGIDATVELRKNNYKGIIIACTANSGKEDFAEYKRIGINDILIKPFKWEDVEQLLKKWDSVLLQPRAKSIVSLTSIHNKVLDIWDLSALMKSAGNDVQLAKSLMEDYINQCQTILANIKKALENPLRDYNKLALSSKTLKTSSKEVCVYKLEEYGNQMEKAILQHDMAKFDSIRTNFVIVFLKLKIYIENWENAV